MTTALALWLANNVNAIAADESAGAIFNDIQNAVDSIERMINRPIPPRYAGPCPTMTDNGPCDTALLADRKATEVTCPSCAITHDIETIESELWERVDEWLLSSSELHLVMEYFGEPVPASTIRRWRMEKRLNPRGFRDGKPRYWVKDVRTLRSGGQVA